MHMGKIEAERSGSSGPKGTGPDETPAREAPGSVLLGLAVLLIALPYWAVRLLAAALWRDLRRAAHAARIVGQSYNEERTRR